MTKSKRPRGQWHWWALLDADGDLILVAPTRKECRELKEPGERVVLVNIQWVGVE